MTYYLSKGEIKARSYPLQSGEYIFEAGTQFRKRNPALMGDGFFMIRHSCCHTKKELKNDVLYLEKELNTKFESVTVADQEKEAFIEKYGK